MDIKVEIYINRMVISSNGVTKTLIPKSNYSTTRLLVGNFLEAEECLKSGLKEIGATSIFNFLRPTLNIYPMEKSEGGLSGIEHRVLMELGFGAGAKKTIIHA